MKKLAHRGYSALYPENTMEAFRQAYDAGFDGVETDVQMTLDHQLVLIHDETVDRTSQSSGFVKDLTLAQLKQMNFCYQNEGHYPIATLEELLAFIQGKDFVVNIELKTDRFHYENIEQMVYDLVKKYHVEDQIYYSSFYLPSLIKIKMIDPSVYAAYLMEDHYEQRIADMHQHHIMAIHPRYDHLDEDQVAQFKKDQIMIGVWTVPDQHEYQRMKNLGVDLIISNDHFE